MKLLPAFSFLTLFTLVGCDTSTPKCNSNDAHELIVNIAHENYGRKNLYNALVRLGLPIGTKFSEVQFSVINTRTTHHEPQLDIYQCAADLELTHNAARETRSIPITYQIQKTDNGDNQFYINVYGL
ncbi:MULTISPECIES: hypothetical protein [Klebsiella]|uniref:hypothetical protein n=1 Tax=Klebsiella TaxID=570 RepID=UPI0020238B87|nr:MULTISPECIES: hypothetical protein [unclassified Klebsiella]MCS6029415.1 hypothetical protein [Klebsiella quasipneumoniae subsp. quasipneumoniae]HCD1274938.1 hypothetical protein [Citrobacter amalonaticus]MDK1754956.1 hypothetical protein [Klebsiella sp. K5-322]MDK1839841.1 hypothetical protein [Klebsiella sp. K5-204]HCB1239872.1 hypothetical protein [Klebsiella quasipneumoniae subsp. quasipneumoniae]